MLHNREIEQMSRRRRNASGILGVEASDIGMLYPGKLPEATSGLLARIVRSYLAR